MSRSVTMNYERYRAPSGSHLTTATGDTMSHMKTLECTTCGETKTWNPIDANTPKERTTFIQEHLHGAPSIYADTDSLQECICGWYAEPHGELMVELEPDCKVHFPKP